MKVLIPFTKLMLKQWRFLSLGLALGVLTLLSGLALLSLSGWFIASAAFAGLHAATAAAFNYLLPASGVRFASMTRIISRYGERVTTHEATFKILTCLRVWIYQKIEPLVPAHLSLYRSGNLLNRLVSDIDAMDNLYIRVLLPIISASIVALVILFFLHFINVKLAWLVFAFLVFSGLIAPLTAHVLGRSTSKQLQIKIAKLRISLLDYIQGVKELRLFAAEKKTVDAINIDGDKLISLQSKMAMIKGFAIALMSLLMGATIWLALYFGVSLVHASLLGGAMLALMVLAIMAGFEAISPIPLAFQYLGKTSEAASQLHSLASEKPCVIFNDQLNAVIRDASVEFLNVDFSYDKRASIFKDFNLQISAGEKLGILGPTGSGKTTLVNLLSRAWDVQTGSIEIGGVNIKTLTEAQLRSSLSIISQRSYIFNATIRDNLLLAKPDATDEELWHALNKVQLKSFVSELPDGLDTWSGEHGFRFSGGQIRRLALARAVLHNAPIWILDEPTEGLDFETRSKLLAELKALMKNKTVIMISHRESDLRNMDRVLSSWGSRSENPGSRG